MAVPCGAFVVSAKSESGRMTIQPKSLSRRDFVRGAAGVAVTAMAGTQIAPANAQSSRAHRPNLLFVLTDQWRNQAMGYSQQDPVLTPRLDAFHDQATAFTQAIACTPVCGPNRACLFTGRYPQHHGVLKNGAAAARPEQLLSRVFKDSGYRNGYIGKWHLTGADAHKVHGGITSKHLRADYEYWTSAIHNHAHFSLAFEEDGERVNYGSGWQPDHVTRKAIEFMGQADDRPFNLVVSYSPPHNGNYHPEYCTEKRYTPGDISHRANGYGYYAPPKFENLYLGLSPSDIRPNVEPIPRQGEEGFDTIATAIAGYYGACTALDASFGQLLDHLRESGLDDNTIVVFTSDHGEMMGSHGLMTKGVCFEESINVPLMIRMPGARASSSDVLINSIDLMPTLMGLCGLDVPSGIDGQSFAASLRGMSNAIEPEMASIGYAKFRGWRTPRYTYVSTTHPSGHMVGREATYLVNKRGTRASHILLDLVNDPYQLRPILRGDAAVTDGVIDDFQYALHLDLKERGEMVPEKIASTPSTSIPTVY